MKKLGILINILFVTVSIQAQNKQQFGLLLNDQSYNGIKRLYAPNYQFGIMDIPATGSLEDFAPPIINQKNQPTGTTQAIGQGLMSMLYAIQYPKKKPLIFSHSFLYHQLSKGDCDKEFYLKEVLELVKEKGICKIEDFSPKSCENQPNAAILKQATNFKIKDYFALFEINDNTKAKIARMAHALHEKHPVLIGMSIPHSFLSLDAKNPIWQPEKENRTTIGAHAMVVVGYDLEQQMFKVRNTWGTDWGAKGYGWIRFEDFAKYVHYGIILVPDFKETKSKNLTGTFTYRYPVFDEKEEYTFEEAQVEKEKNYYTTKKENWEEGAMFQLKIEAMQTHSYLYVFSLNAKSKAFIHFPPKTEKDSVVYEHSYILSEEQEIVIPGKGRALIKEREGTDYLYLLYSDKPLEDFKDIVKKVETDTANFEERLKSVLGKRLIITNQAAFQKDKLAFDITYQKGHIVGVLLMVKSNE